MTSPNLLEDAQAILEPIVASQLATMLRESDGVLRLALQDLVPVVIGVMCEKGSTPAGAAELMVSLRNGELDTSVICRPGWALDDTAITVLMKAGGGCLAPALFGARTHAVVEALSSVSGLRRASATSLILLTVPLALTALKSRVDRLEWDATSLPLLLRGQRTHLRGRLNARLTSALGYATPSALLGALAVRAVAAPASMRQGWFKRLAGRLSLA